MCDSDSLIYYNYMVNRSIMRMHFEQDDPAFVQNVKAVVERYQSRAEV